MFFKNTVNIPEGGPHLKILLLDINAQTSRMYSKIQKLGPHDLIKGLAGSMSSQIPT